MLLERDTVAAVSLILPWDFLPSSFPQVAYSLSASHMEYVESHTFTFVSVLMDPLSKL